MEDIGPLIDSLLTSSYGRYRAGIRLAAYGRAVEVPLVHVLAPAEDPDLIFSVLEILSKVKVSEPASVDAVVRRLTHRDFHVRRAAASCLLQSSPRLRRALPQIRAILARETDTVAQGILQKLVDRYPIPDRAAGVESAD